MKIIEKKIGDVIPYENNPRKNDNAVKYVANSIREFGFKVPIVVDRNNVIVAGHTRLKAAQELGLQTVPVVVADDLTPEQVKAFRLADNKTGEIATWDEQALEAELADIGEYVPAFEKEISDLKKNQERMLSLSEPFKAEKLSVLDGRSGPWAARKKIWRHNLRSEEGREECLLGGYRDLMTRQGGSYGNGTSAFCPVLTETLCSWYCARGGKVLDPFAGGSVRGVVASFKGHEYHGVDLSARQIRANENCWAKLPPAVRALMSEKPRWYVGKAQDIDEIVTERGFDMLLSCPPYFDLEKYNDGEGDLSMMMWDDFLSDYRLIIRKSVDMLKENALAVFVVGDVRGKDGYYRGFPAVTIDAFAAAGCKLLDYLILLDALSTAPSRAAMIFRKRKIVKVHQDVLVFARGDISKMEFDE